MSTKHLTLRSKTYDALLDMILSGKLPSGSAIDEKALTEELLVSRTPFREAISLLAKDGLVEIKPYRGFSVRRYSAKEVGDLYDLRRVLESFATRLAVENVSNNQIQQLEQLLDAGVRALEVQDMRAYADHDKQFHDTIARLSGNEALMDNLARLSRQIQICRVIANQSQDFTDRAVRERDDILQAFRRRDGQRASELMDIHIRDVKDQVMRQLALIDGTTGEDPA